MLCNPSNLPISGKTVSSNDLLSNSKTIFDNDFDTKINYYMQEGHITSLATSITYNNDIYITKGYGDQNNSNDVFMIGSITKSITATAILQLKEKGLIKDLNDDVSKYLGYQIQNPKIPTAIITIKDLLANRGGLNDYGTKLCVTITFTQMFNESPIFKPLYTGESYLPYPQWVKQYFINNGQYYNPSNWMEEPVNFEYSNCGYFLLGTIIESITKQSLENYFYQIILKPIGMESTHMYLENYSINNLVTGNIWVKDSPDLYNDFGLKNENSNFPQYDSNGYGAGGLHSTAQDLAKFLISQETGYYNGFQLLSPNLITLMHKNQGNDTSYFYDGEYGFGWMIGEENFMIGNNLIQVKKQGHGGNSPNYWAYIQNVNQIFENGTIGKNTVGIVLLVNQGYNLRENDAENNFPDILNFITQFAVDKLLINIQQNTTTIPTSTSTIVSSVSQQHTTTIPASTSTFAYSVIVISVSINIYRKKLNRVKN